MGQHIQGKVSAQGKTSSPVEEDQEGGMERNMNPRLNHAIMLLAALLAIALVGCGQAGQEELPTTTTPTEWNLDEPKPISSNSAVTMTTEEILEITGEYMAVNLWAQTAHRTADEHPESFHQMLFSDPPRGCVEEHRDLLEVMPNPAGGETDRLQRSQCRRRTGPTTGDQIEPDEREARARRSVGLLFWSLDPPTLMSVMIAQSERVGRERENESSLCRIRSQVQRLRGGIRQIRYRTGPGKDTRTNGRDMAEIRERPEGLLRHGDRQPI